MKPLAIITVLGLAWCAHAGQPPLYQVLAVIPHGRSPPPVDLTSVPQKSESPVEDMVTSSSQFYPTFDEYDDFRPKRESDDPHPDAYLRPPSEDSTPIWQDGNNWDLGYDPDDILSPPMPLSMGIPYDTIKLSADDPRVLEVQEAQGSSPHRQETRPTKQRKYKNRPSKKRQPSSHGFSSQKFPDYEDSKPYSKRHNRYTDYEEPPSRSNKRQTYRGYQESDYDEPPQRPQKSSFSYAQTDQSGHFKWGVRHHQ